MKAKRYKSYNTELAETLRKGAVGIFPTDTLYGLVASALLPDAVRRVYALRKRNPKKPFIILIHNPADVARFGVRVGTTERTIVKKMWPGKVSIVLRSSGTKSRYLRAGGATLAFRVPASRTLRTFLRKSGPLVAPSANPGGKKPAYSIKEAERYFGDRVDFYCDKGRLSGKASMLVSIIRGRIETLRK